MLREGLGRVGEADETLTPRVPRTVAEIRRLSTEDLEEIVASDDEGVAWLIRSHLRPLASRQEVRFARRWMSWRATVSPSAIRSLSVDQRLTTPHEGALGLGSRDGPRHRLSRRPGRREVETRVGVQMGAKRGRVTIDFADLEDLERIYRLIAGER